MLSAEPTNANTVPEPECGAGVILSVAEPVILRSKVSTGGSTRVDSAPLTNPKSEPEPAVTTVLLSSELPSNSNRVISPIGL